MWYTTCLNRMNTVTFSPRRTILGLWYGTLAISLMVTIAVSVVMLKDVGPTKAFSWHPILMTISFLLCMTQGMHAYLLGWGGGNSDGNNTSNSNTERIYHGICMVFALVTALVGYIVMFIAHQGGKGHTAHGDPLSKQIHTWLGYGILMGVLIQCGVGMTKYVLVRQDVPKRFAKWHGKLGPLLWFLGCGNIFLGVYFWSSPTYTLPVQISTAIGVVLVVLITMLFLEIRPKEILQHNGTAAPTNTDVDTNELIGSGMISDLS